jgi:hypothetical protein
VVDGSAGEDLPVANPVAFAANWRITAKYSS